MDPCHEIAPRRRDHRRGRRRLDAVDELLARGFGNLTVLDISTEVLRRVADRLAAKEFSAQLIAHDVTRFSPTRSYALWHDRAVFHFLTDAVDRQRYRDVLSAATHAGSHVLISTFGPQGPTRCSGLDTARYDATHLAAELGPEFQLERTSLEIHMTPASMPQQFLHTHFIRI